MLDVGPPGSWDSEWAGCGRVIIDSLYRMWYTGSDGMHRQIGYATSRDGIYWTKHDANPVLAPSLGAWDSVEACFGYVTLTGSKYQMWYSGGDGRTYRRIGYARSSDGIFWTKSASSILGGGSSPMESMPLTSPSVIGPDSTGGFKMWFSTMFDTDLESSQIGLAEGVSATSWIARQEPVLTPGDAGSFDAGELRIPRVTYNEPIYEMWCSGSISNIGTWKMEYATSADGIHWKKHPDNPVLDPGPPGSWDIAVWAGDVLFERNMYYMWYVGSSSIVPVIRTGLAVSPKGMTVSFTPTQSPFSSGNATIYMAVKVSDPKDLTFSASILAPEEEKDRTQNVLSALRQVGKVELFDDGNHGDGLAGDGLFANTWNTSSEEELYVVDLKMKLQRRTALGFEMKNAGAFTTIGPMAVDSVIFVGDATPTPGATVLLKLILRNHGRSLAASSVTAALSAADSLVTDVTSTSPSYGHVFSGSRAVTSGYYSLVISPDCPPNTDVKLNVVISSLGIQLWNDTFSFRVLPPWWRTDWAHVLYGVLGLAVLYGVQRFETRRTRRKHQLEMERFQAEKLRELDQLKSRFFANISHEFRTPLTLIEGPAKQLASGDAADVTEQAGMIVRNSQRLLRLVNQLLDLSKIESGEMKLRVREMDIVEIVRGTAAAFESLAKRKGVQYTIVTPDDPIIGWFDRDAVEKILTNLLSNAFKFTPAGGEVKVSVSKDAFSPDNPRMKASFIKVADTGIGIRPDQLDKIFDRFYQVDASQTREQEGTGIGLALTKELVELHKGEITAASEPGKGSTFTVRLPLGKEHLSPDELVVLEELSNIHATSTAEFEEQRPGEPQEDQKVDETFPLLLIIEDNSDMRHYMRTHLEKGNRIVEAENGIVGIDKAVASIPDLIISDVMMPNMDGFEVCKRLKTDERTSHIPVILLTAKAGTEHKIEGLEIGADEYVTKPFDARELQVRVKNLIEQRKNLRERFRREGTFRLKEMVITSADERFLNRAMEVAEAHISDQTFTAELFAQEMYLSRMQLHRKIKALTDHSPWEFVRIVRMERASQLLRAGVGTVSEIAYQVGFDDPSHFAEVFRRQFGLTPSEYMRHQRNP